MPHPEVAYLDWVKKGSQARWNLACSGLASVKWSELGIDPAALEISDGNGYGYAPLIERIAARYGAQAENVCVSAGASLANFLVMASVLRRGDQVLVERPCYEPLYRAAEFLGAEVSWLERRFEDGYRVDPDRLAACLTPRTRLVILTNLHNPTGNLLDETTLLEVGEAAARIGAYVLVDEAYLEFVEGVRPAWLYGDHFISTNTLTKVYGLSGLRCGWILGSAEIARRARLITNYIHLQGVLLGEIVSAAAFDKMDWLTARSQALIRANRPLLDSFLASNRDFLDCVLPGAGPICFPRLRHTTGNELAALLKQKYETSIVDGQYFGCGRHVRISAGNETAIVRQGLENVSEGLKELSAGVAAEEALHALA